MTNRTHQGRCLCGQTRFEIQEPVIRSVHCHCESCRRHSSAPFMTMVGVEDGQWRWTGAAPALYRSSSGVERQFCGTCGAPMSFRSVHLTGKIHFPLPAFEDPEAFPPEQHGFVAEKLGWVHLADGLPQNHGNTP